jgi:N-acetylmuramoyl-L-alanine amidase
MYKYTYGASTDYNSIVKKRKEISKKFSEAFIVAFKNGKRIDTNKAIEEFKKNNK